ncbi:MAG: ribonuclease P protein component 4 [Candidatus Hadarchaeales archaeon]
MNKWKKIALERIERLLDLAEEIYESNPQLAERYVQLAWKIKTRYTIRFSKILKRRFCKKCFSIWIPGKTVRVRIKRGIIIWSCLSCGRVYRIPFKQQKSKRED